MDRLRASDLVLNKKPSGHPRNVTASENVLVWWFAIKNHVQSLGCLEWMLLA